MKYRIVTDYDGAFNVQYRPAYWPFWNNKTYVGHSMEACRNLIEEMKKDALELAARNNFTPQVVYEEDK